MNIFHDKHLNMDCISLQQDNIKVKVIPELGFKVASMTYEGNEMLFQPTDGEYSKLSYGSNFEYSDTSGMDEMIPTIDKCVVGGKRLPDHGDVWSVPWDFDVFNDYIEGYVKLNSLPLRFSKAVQIKNDYSIQMDYCVQNLSGERVPFLWALHGLNVIGKGTKIELPKSVKEIYDVNKMRTEAVDNDGIIEIESLVDGVAYKYYISNHDDKCRCSLLYPDKNIKYSIDFKGKENPYLGIWITKGGFKGEYNCALEPSNGFYDSLDRAIGNCKYESLEPFDEKRWNITIKLSKIRD